MTDPTLTYDGVVERTPEGGMIRFERALPYPVRDVWAAITDPARLIDWWLPFDADITVDLREGGAMHFAGRGTAPDGGAAPDFTCTILRVEAPLLLEHTHPDAESRMRWELEPTGTGCTLRLTHFITDVDAAIERCYVVGLHTSLSRLEPSIAGEPVGWDWAEYAASQAAYAALGFAPEVTEEEA